MTDDCHREGPRVPAVASAKAGPRGPCMDPGGWAAAPPGRFYG
jgi:hypothetical protein